MGHANLAREALRTRRYDPSLGGTGDLLREIAWTDPQTVILSSEVFTVDPGSPQVPRWAIGLAEELGTSDVQVIAYVRPQSGYLESSYPYRVRRGDEQVQFAEYVARRIQDPRLDYSLVFRAWRDLFGDQLTVRPYDRARLVAQDAVDDFWHSVDRLPDQPTKKKVETRNPRPGAKATELMRLLRRTLSERGLDRGGRIGPVLAQARQTIEANLPDDVPWQGLTPRLVAQIYTHFEKSNRAFVHHFGETHRQLLERPEVDEHSRPWRLDDASLEEKRLYEYVCADAIAALMDQASRPAQRSLRRRAS